MSADPRIHLPRDCGPKIARYSVITPTASLRKKPSNAAAQESEIIYGQAFDVYRLSRGWAWGQLVTPSQRPGYIGYVKAKSLGGAAPEPTNQVISMGAPVFTKPDIKSYIAMVLPLNALLSESSEGEGEDFIHIGPKQYVHRKNTRLLSSQRSAEQIEEAHRRLLEEPPTGPNDYVSVAEAHIGLPYIWGGVSSFGLDCSGLVQSSLRAAGCDVPRDSDMQMNEIGTAMPIKLRGLARGDLIFWKGHVAIMSSETEIVHANAHHMKTAREPLKRAAQRIKASGGGDILAIRRL